MEADKSRQRANRPDVRLYRPPASRLGRLSMTEETKECPEPEAITRINGNISHDRHRIKNPFPQWNNFSEELPVDSKKQNANRAPSTQSRSTPDRPNARQSRGGRNRNKAPPRHQLSDSVMERQVSSTMAPTQSSYHHQHNGNQSTPAREYRNSSRVNQLSISSDSPFSNVTNSTAHPNEAQREYPPTRITSQPSDKAAPLSKQHSAKVKLRWQDSDDSHISNDNCEYRTNSESVPSERPRQQQQSASMEHRRRPPPERQHLVAINDSKGTSATQKNAAKKDQLKMDNTKSANGTKTRGLITLKATSSAPVAIRPSAPSSLPKERNSLSNASSHSAASNSSLSTPPKGGLLRLNNESMKILNQTMKNDSEKRARQNARDNGAHFPAETSAVNLDFDYARRLAEKLDYFIHSRLSQGGLIDHTDPMGESLRHQLMSFYETVLLSDYKVAGQKQALQLIWSQCFYPFVDAYRAEISKCPANVRKGKAPAGTAIPVTTANPAAVQHSLGLLASIVNEGTHFFEGLLQKLRSAYDVSYKSLLERRKHYDLNRALFSRLQDITFYVKIIFIYLGDLTRYYESAQIQPNFESPKAYYMKAHLLVPKNSHACSQIAMLSYYQKNYFDSLYFFIRSFETEMNPDSSPKAVKGSVPPSSRHRHKSMLPQLFDDIRPGFEENLRKLKADFEAHQVRNKVARQRLNASHMHINRNYRIEYWIRPTGTISKCDMYNFYDLAAIASNNEDDPDLLNFYFTHILPQYSSTDLKKRFIYSFLIVHGMLNCRSGLDSFFDVSNQMILEFDCLLHHGYTSCGTASSEGLMSLSSMRLIQLMTINFYSISNTLTEEDSRKNAAQYSFTHMNAYFIMSTMMTMILRRLISLGEVFRRKHGQFMEEFVSLNRKDGKGVPRVSREESREVFEEDSAHIESLFAFSKKRTSNSASNGEREAVQQQTVEAETAAQLQDWKDFYQLLPLVKIWTDWVISAKPRFPPHEMNDLKTSRQDENLWQVFARFLTFLDEFKFYPVNFYIDPSNEASPLALTAPKIAGNLKNCEYELVQLPEDRCLDGFKLILNAPESSKYIRLPFVPEIAYTYMRISSIQTFGDYLCGMKQPYLRFCSRTNQYESLVGLDDIEGHPGLKLQNIQEEVFRESLRQLQLPSHSEGESSAESGVQTDDEDDYEDEEEAIEEMTRLDIASAERRQLRQYRMLKKQNPRHGCYFKMLSHRNEHHQRYIIKPRYVIFDTNCFINDLGAIKQIFLKTVPFTVTIPLIVVHELESMMARGQRIVSEQTTIGSEMYGQPDSPKTERYLDLAKKATEVMEFLKEAFTHYRNCIRSVTGKGTLLDTIEYTEDGNDSNTFNNDDVILYSCTNLIGDGQVDNSRKNMEKLLKDAGEKISNGDDLIYRDVILVTDDVNLRLKSLGHQVPVKKLTQFLKWIRALYREMDQRGQSPKPKTELPTA